MMVEPNKEEGNLLLIVIEGKDLTYTPINEKKKNMAQHGVQLFKKSINKKLTNLYEGTCIIVNINKKSMITSNIFMARSCLWDEEFYFEGVKDEDIIHIICIDRFIEDSNDLFPIVSSTIQDNPAFIGDVYIPLSSLIHSESIEQWFHLKPKHSKLKSNISIKIFIKYKRYINNRILLNEDITYPLSEINNCNNKLNTLKKERSMSIISNLNNNNVNIEEKDELNKESSNNTTNDNILTMGLIDYFLLIGPRIISEDMSSPKSSEYTNENLMNENCNDILYNHDICILNRYPEEDNKDFPLPTKIEWFGLPGGLEIITKKDKPTEKTFSFFLIGGDDGTCKTYANCLLFYESSCICCPNENINNHKNRWLPYCICFVSRIPLVNDLEKLLSYLYDYYNNTKYKKQMEYYIYQLIKIVPIPIKDILGIRISFNNKENNNLSFLLSLTSKHNKNNEKDLKNNKLNSHSHLYNNNVLKTSKSFEQVLHYSQFSKLVYSLSYLFEVFHIKNVIQLIIFALCEYRILVMSSDFSLLCPIIDSICTLMYPFVWEHPFIPILPKVLAEYLQAPLPYILGIHSSWLEELLPVSIGRPDKLVLVNIDTGEVTVDNSNIHNEKLPELPMNHTAQLFSNLMKIIYPEIINLDSIKDNNDMTDSTGLWTEEKDYLIRKEFTCFITSFIYGYRDCLFFIDKSIPVFNKQRFFELYANPEASQFLNIILSSQSFEAFLENHDSHTLNAFHCIYQNIRLGKEISLSYISPLISNNNNNNNQDEPILDIYLSTVPENDNKLEQTYDSIIFLNISLFEKQNHSYLKENEKEISFDEVAIDSNISKEWFYNNRQKLNNPFLTFHSIHSADNNEKNRNENSFFSSYRRDRTTTSSEEKIEQCFQKCMTVIFSSGETLSSVDLKACNDCFKFKYARDLFVLILTQSKYKLNKYNNHSIKNNTNHPAHSFHQGNGTCLGDIEFYLLETLANEMLIQCYEHQDFSNARGLLQLAAQYYKFIKNNDVEDIMSQATITSTYNKIMDQNNILSGFGKKQYLQYVLRKQPICRSLEMWQDAFRKDIETPFSGKITRDMTNTNTVNTNNNNNEVTDDIFFSHMASLIHDMLNLDVPIEKVRIFVTGMCSTFNKTKLLNDTLLKLVENVHRALTMSTDSEIENNNTKQNTFNVENSKNHSKNHNILSPSRLFSMGLNIKRTNTKLDNNNNNMNNAYDLDNFIKNKFLHKNKKLNKNLKLISRSNSRSLEETSISFLNFSRSRSKSSNYSIINNQNKNNNETSLPWINEFSQENDMNSSQSPRKSEILTSEIMSNNNHSCPVTCICSNDILMASGGIDGIVHVSFHNNNNNNKINYNKIKYKFEGHTAPISCIKIRNNKIISASYDNTIRIWDLNNNNPMDINEELLNTNDKNHLFHVNSQSNILISNTTNNENISIQRIKNKKNMNHPIILKGHVASILCMEIGKQISKNNFIIASGSKDTSIRIWQSNNNNNNNNNTINDSKKSITSTLYSSLSSHIILNSHMAPITCLRFTLQYDKLISGCQAGSYNVWDLNTNKLLFSTIQSHNGWIQDIQISGDRIFTCGNDRLIKLWDIRCNTKNNLKPVQIMKGHNGPVRCLAVGGPADPNICSGSADNVIKVWDLRYINKINDEKNSYSRLHLDKHEAEITSIYRNFNKIISSSLDGTIKIWDLHMGYLIAENDKNNDKIEGGVSSLLINEEKSIMYSSGWDHYVRKWNIEKLMLE